MKRVAMTTILTIFLGGFIVASTRWAVEMSLPRTKTITTQKWAPEYGNLTLSATLVAENEVVLDATFSSMAYVNQPGFVWTLSVSNSNIPKYTNLPEGLELVEGTNMINCSCPVVDGYLSLQARLRAIADGEWIIYGKFSASHGPGFSMSTSTDGIEISVSNGSIVKLEKAPYPTNSPNQQPNNQTENLLSPPIR